MSALRVRLTATTLALLCLALLTTTWAATSSASRASAAAAADPVIGALGDMVCDPTRTEPQYDGSQPAVCQHRAVADLAASSGLSALLALGDLQYEDGAYDKFVSAYSPTFGRLRAITRPAVGNHEYGVEGARGYFDYFGTAAGPRGQGWYASTVGSWRLLALNTNCHVVDCSATSPQVQWLRQQLATSPTTCTLAYFHQPRFTSSPRGSDPGLDPVWQALYDGGVDVVLNGHEHNYERFGPQDPAGRPDPRGIRQFIVGTGGRGLSPIGPPIANSEVRTRSDFGLLLMTLEDGGYDWRFATTGGRDLDSGSAACGTRTANPAPPAGPAPGAPAPVTPPPPAPPAAPAPAPAPCGAPTTSLGVRASTAGQAVGVRLRGTAGRPVELLAASAPASARVVRSAVLGPDGTVALTVRPSTNTLLRTRERGCAAGPTAALTVRTAVSLAVAPAPGRAVVLSGTTAPARSRGRVVTLSRLTSTGALVPVARVDARADGRWRLPRLALRQGTHRLVATTAADARNGAGASPVRTVVVR